MSTESSSFVLSLPFFFFSRSRGNNDLSVVEDLRKGLISTKNVCRETSR